MFSECERKCLLAMAADCKRSGMTRSEAQARIEADVGGFCTRFRIAQAVTRVFSPQPDVIHA